MALGLGLGLSLSRGSSGSPAVVLAYDPVVIFMGDSQNLTQGDTTAATAYNSAYVADPKVLILNTAGARVQYAPGTITGLNFSSNKGEPGPEIGFLPPFRAAYPSNTLRLINLSAPGSYAGRGATNGTCTGYVSSGVSGVAGNVFTLSSGVMPSAGTLITGTGISAGTMIASFGPGGNTRYIYQAGVSGFGLSFAAGTSGAPITVTKYGYSWSTTEGILYWGSDGSITNGYKSRVTAAISAMTGEGLTPKVIAVVILLGTNDMGDTTAGGLFSTGMSGLITQIKSDWPLTDAKIILVEAKSGATASTTVRAAQQSIADGDSQVYLMDADGASFTLSDGTHYTVVGRTAIGSAAYDIWSGPTAGTPLGLLLALTQA